MSFNFANLTKDLKTIGNKLSSDFNNEFLPMAQRTSRMVQERIGQVKVDDISQLPLEYTDLADKCNNIENLYKNILKVTATYENESYDYPNNLQESFTEFGKNVGTRVANLSKATTPAEAQQAFLGELADIKPPKTLYHAIARATDGSVLTSTTGDQQPLVKGLDIYSSTMTKIANARLGQDQLIVSKFNKPLQTTLRQLISQSNNIQKKVEQKRIDYDLARHNLAGCTNPVKELQLRVAMESAEDDFANSVEDAVNIMQNVLANAQPLYEFLELIKAQLAFHKLALELLGDTVVKFEDLVQGGITGSEKLSARRDSGDFEI